MTEDDNKKDYDTFQAMREIWIERAMKAGFSREQAEFLKDNLSMASMGFGIF